LFVLFFPIPTQQQAVSMLRLVILRHFCTMFRHAQHDNLEKEV